MFMLAVVQVGLPTGACARRFFRVWALCAGFLCAPGQEGGLFPGGSTGHASRYLVLGCATGHAVGAAMGECVFHEEGMKHRFMEVVVSKMPKALFRILATGHACHMWHHGTHGRVEQSLWHRFPMFEGFGCRHAHDAAFAQVVLVPNVMLHAQDGCIHEWCGRVCGVEYFFSVCNPRG